MSGKKSDKPGTGNPPDRTSGQAGGLVLADARPLVPEDAVTMKA